ncbi:hypothetical protein V7O66_09880 [Methanolobus sp. ZRKC3]|uniref:hypothetical protein n=1 Tax=Methanolobus sp. ZRKC3 TaxID=3125786 RepID=UPI003253F9F5
MSYEVSPVWDLEIELYMGEDESDSETLMYSDTVDKLIFLKVGVLLQTFVDDKTVSNEFLAFDNIAGIKYKSEK